MTATQLITITSVAAVVVSALAIAAGLKGVRDQLRVTVFLTYTDRYARVMAGIPFEARQPGSAYRLAGRPDDERTRVLSAFREYFNLCSEEKWLYENRKIDRATWDIWVRSMQVVAQFPCFGEAWEALRFEYHSYEEFQHFVTGTLLPHTVAQVHEDRTHATATGTNAATSDPTAGSSAKPPRREPERLAGTAARADQAGRTPSELKTTIGQLRRRATVPMRRTLARLLKLNGR